MAADLERNLGARFLEHFDRAEVSADQDGYAALRLVDDLGFDSIELFELLVILEEALRRPLDEDFMMGIQTVGDVCHFLAEAPDPEAAFDAAAGL